MKLEIEDRCFSKALLLVERGIVKLTENMDIFGLTDLLISLEKEKIDKQIESDKVIEYNNEIVSIEDTGVLETIDISVSGDNLFYCNNILTQNSFGLPATADFMFAMISTDELDEMNQILIKQLKNRYNDTIVNRKFILGINRAKMKLTDVKKEEQANIPTPNPKKDFFGMKEQSQSSNVSWKF